MKLNLIKTHPLVISIDLILISKEPVYKIYNINRESAILINLNL